MSDEEELSELSSTFDKILSKNNTPYVPKISRKTETVEIDPTIGESPFRITRTKQTVTESNRAKSAITSASWSGSQYDLKLKLKKIAVENRNFMDSDSDVAETSEEKISKYFLLPQEKYRYLLKSINVRITREGGKSLLEGRFAGFYKKMDGSYQVLIDVVGDKQLRLNIDNVKNIYTETPMSTCLSEKMVASVKQKPYTPMPYGGFRGRYGGGVGI